MFAFKVTNKNISEKGVKKQLGKEKVCVFFLIFGLPQRKNCCLKLLDGNHNNITKLTHLVCDIEP